MIKIVDPYFRRVSSKTTLAEMARILHRNKFAVVDEIKFITTSDLLKKICDPNVTELECDDYQPRKDKEKKVMAAKAETSAGGKSMVAVAAATVGMGVMAAGAFFMMKQNK